MHPFIYRELILAREADLRRRVELDRRVNAVISDRRRWRLPPVRWGSRRPSGPATGRSTEMAKFMDVHSGFTGVTEDQLHAAHQRSPRVDRREGRLRGERGRAGQLRPGQPERAGRQRVLARQSGAGDRPIVRVQAHVDAPAQQRRERVA